MAEFADAVHRAAERVHHATSTARAYASVRDLIGDDVEAAYAVQDLVTELREIGGARPWGRSAVPLAPGERQRWGYGAVLDTMVLQDGSSVAAARFVEPRIGATVCLRLSGDVRAEATDAEIVAAIAGVALALEVSDTRVAAGDEAHRAAPSDVDVIGDGGGTVAVVVGPEFTLKDAPGPWPARVLQAGAAEDRDECLTRAEALAQIRDVATAAAGRGRPLVAGEVVLLQPFGECLPMVETGRYEVRSGGGTVIALTMTDSSHPPRAETFR
jgi:2-keto-4-pentenoate hydratase